MRQPLTVFSIDTLQPSFKALSIVIASLVVSACGSSSNGNTVPVGSSNTSVESTNGPTSSSVNGVINLMNAENSTAELAISVRNADVSGTVQPSGEFTIELPISDTERTVTLDISGDDVIPKSVIAHIPANSEMIRVNADVAARTPALTFDLDEGGVLRNSQSPTNISVTVPANAFQLPDGTVATEEAQVSITEIDITDLYGESSWAPGLVGIPVGSTEPSAIRTFGMADFHFTQNGQKLQLRPGMEATIAMDFIDPVMMTTGSNYAVEAVAGATMPLWHHDPSAMVWKEEGFATISANDGSNSGFSASGNVSHFSTWNIDWRVPFVEAAVIVELVDLLGRTRSDLTVESYTTEVRVPAEDGEAHGVIADRYAYDPDWISTKQMTPSNNKIDVLSNNADRQRDIDNPDLWITDWLYMEFRLSNVIVRELGVVDMVPDVVRKIFRETDNDHSIVIQVVIPDA